MEFDLKWVHMARCELILRLDGALPPHKKKTLLAMTATATLLDYRDSCRTLARTFWAPPLTPKFNVDG